VGRQPQVPVDLATPLRRQPTVPRRLDQLLEAGDESLGKRLAGHQG